MKKSRSMMDRCSLWDSEVNSGCAKSIVALGFADLSRDSQHQDINETLQEHFSIEESRP